MSVHNLIHRPAPHFIGSSFRPAHGAPITVTDPSTGQALAEIDVADAVATFDYCAAEAEALDTRQGQPVAMPEGIAGRTRFEPVGPVGMIVPWNFPRVSSAWKIAPEAGRIWINSGQVIPPQTAWGGFKASGIGRELSPWGPSSYVGVKHLTIAAAAA
jgi:acyl-CoA reductase-like NAD-dependent aldehyde dehydrogenase